MVSDQSLTLNVSPRLTVASPPLPASSEAPASHQHPLNPAVSSAPDDDNAVVFGPQSSDPRPSIGVDDIVIAVMGITRVGKSSFINKAAGGEKIAITNNLVSQTRTVQPVRCLHPDGRRNVVLVDTPGFDDTYLSDDLVLKIIAHWLNETYQNNIKLSGVLYLHRVSDNRVGGASRRDFAVFKDMCGKDSMKNIVLVTTMWDEVEDLPDGPKIEEVLSSVFWKDMIRHGSRTRRFQGTLESAWEIIDCLDAERSGQRRTPLQIQREMVDRGLPFDNTSAAKTLKRLQRAGETKKCSEKLRNKFRRKTTSRRPEKTAAKALHCSLDQRRAGEGNTSSTNPHNKSRQKTTSRTLGSMATKYLRRCLTQLAKVRKFLTKLRNKSHQKAAPREPPPSSTESARSLRKIHGGQGTLSTAISALELAHEMADVANPMLRGVIGTALRIAQLTQEMGGTHHAVAQVVESTGWLLDEITQHARRSMLSRDMERALSSFQRGLDGLENAVAKISGRGHVARFLLHDADIQAITVCTASIKNVCDKLEINTALDSPQAIVRLEDQLTELLTRASSRECGYGMLNVSHGEALGNEQSSASTSEPAMDDRQAIMQLEDQLMASS